MFDMKEMQTVNRTVKPDTEKYEEKMQYLEQEIEKFKSSERRKMMLRAQEYYTGSHDILHRNEIDSGSDRMPVEMTDFPNNMAIDNQYSKMVDQKVNYLLSKPITIETENEKYQKYLNSFFNGRFHRTLKYVCESSLINGIAWLHPYYNDSGELMFHKFESHEILPFWKDPDHNDLEFAVRIYHTDRNEGQEMKMVEALEIYDTNGIHRYYSDGTSLIPDTENPSSAYVGLIDEDGSETAWNWTKIPLIAFRFNKSEIPLLARMKPLQDSMNLILNDLQKNMENILEKNPGNPSAALLNHEAEKYNAILNIIKNTLIENARGYDVKDDSRSANLNQKNIHRIYNDIDLDASSMEVEYQVSLEEICWFINAHLANAGKGDFESEKVKFIFNKNIPNM